MKSDIEIAQATKLEPITSIAKKLNIPKSRIDQYGTYKAKITPAKTDNPTAKLVLVTAINPTPAGEGKTTTSVGLGDALAQLGANVAICLREPSLGPVFGMKGGAAGGGYAQVAPMEDINLHFTGDLHAITTANNLLAAMLDNHIYRGNALNIDPRQITWRRALDMNDRQLRFITSGLGGKTNGMPREDGFNITAASEIMAIFCLSQNIAELKQNLAKIIVAYTFGGKPVTAGDLNAQGAMAALLKSAMSPNLVQTLEGTPAIIHGGPFANIAHGCNSIAATKLAMSFGDFVVTEAGFGADLGAEKFINIKCRRMGIKPDAVVLVVTIRALKHLSGGDGSLLTFKGLNNLKRHIRNITEVYGLPCVVALNRFPDDSLEDIMTISRTAMDFGVDCAESEVFAYGGKGGKDLARAVVKATEKPNNFKYTYDLNTSLTTKINAVAKSVYGPEGVNITTDAARQLRNIENLGYGTLPICMAKTQYSFTDNPKLLGAPRKFFITVREVRLCAGAVFVVVVTGDIMTMPGLPKIPAAEMIDVSDSGVVQGLF